MSRSAGAAGRRTLSADLSLFLVQFSIALHKKTTYPPGHPLLRAATDTAAARLRSLLRHHHQFEIGVARHQLVVGGSPTDPENPVLRDLALRLHRHQLAVLRFSEGTGAEELERLLGAVAVDPRQGGTPLGQQSPDQLAEWPTIRMEPLPLDQLALSDGPIEAGAEAVSRLWLSLVGAALLGENEEQEPGAPGAPGAGSMEPGTLAEAIAGRQHDVTYDRVIVDYLVTLTQALRDDETGGPAAGQVRQQVSELLTQLGPDAIQALLASGASLAQQQSLVSHAARSLPLQAVLELVEAAARASGHDISHSLLRIMGKLASYAGRDDSGGMGTMADTAVRDTIRQLVSSWTLEDPNPGHYRRMLELMAAPTDVETRDGMDGDTGARRIVMMSLELDAAGETLQRAVEMMVDAGDASTLMGLLGVAGDGTAVRAVRRHLATPAMLELILSDESLDPAAVDSLLAGLGPAVAGTMLDVLAESDSITVRRRLLSRLAALGDAIGGPIVERLSGAPWYVLRNLLSLLGGLSRLPDGCDVAGYTTHSDARVRREAWKLLFRDPDARAESLRRALSDPDTGVVELAMVSAAGDCPAAVAQRIVMLIDQGMLRPDTRVQALRTLSTVNLPLARDRLIASALRPRRWLPWRRLAPRGPEVITALDALARRWHDDPSALSVLQLALASRDPEIRAAAGEDAGG